MGSQSPGLKGKGIYLFLNKPAQLPEGTAFEKLEF